MVPDLLGRNPDHAAHCELIYPTHAPLMRPSCAPHAPAGGNGCVDGLMHVEKEKDLPAQLEDPFLVGVGVFGYGCMHPCSQVLL